MNKDLMFSSKKMDWETPQEFFEQLNRKFKFDLDACASDDNHKLDNYFTEKDDALVKKWGAMCLLTHPTAEALANLSRKRMRNI
nr:phage N-6-adenine-methyltransferase [Leuconostoc gasicomitatum]